MNNGPVISSSVGRLMACTLPQKCPQYWPERESPWSQAASSSRFPAASASYSYTLLILSVDLRFSFPGLGFNPFLDAAQLVQPELLKESRPFVQGPDSLGIRAVHHVSSVPPHPYEAHIAEDPQVLRHRGLLHLQRHDDVID